MPDVTHTERRFSPEYRCATSPANPHWRLVRQLTFALTLHRDVLCIWWRATDADHLTYANLGREWPLRDLVPLNRRTHVVVTALRRWGFKPAVNFVLRSAYLAWLAGWALALGFALHAVLSHLW
jgi:hypothetical protein